MSVYSVGLKNIGNLACTLNDEYILENPLYFKIVSLGMG